MFCPPEGLRVQPRGVSRGRVPPSRPNRGRGGARAARRCPRPRLFPARRDSFLPRRSVYFGAVPSAARLSAHLEGHQPPLLLPSPTRTHRPQDWHEPGPGCRSRGHPLGRPNGAPAPGCVCKQHPGACLGRRLFIATTNRRARVAAAAQRSPCLRLSSIVPDCSPTPRDACRGGARGRTRLLQHLRGGSSVGVWGIPCCREGEKWLKSILKSSEGTEKPLMRLRKRRRWRRGGQR